MSEREQVQPGEILQEALGTRASRLADVRLAPLQRVGLWLALVFFAYILIATCTIFFVSFRCIQLPPFPTPPINSGDPAQYKALVDAYKQSAEVYQQMAKLQVERATQLFQLVVASTILPVFSAILGYIFGSKKSGE
jgi:uncharacterized membrane protein